MIRYRFYPTLLNTFARYQRGYLPEQELLDRINRVPIPQTEAQARGVSFEEAVIKGTDEEYFNEEVLRKARALLPRPMVATQVYCQYELDDVLLYGYVDVIGRTLAVDLKTTGSYSPGRFVYNHQNFYLLALRPKGIRTLRYVITDFREVYQEEYDLNMDFSQQEQQIKAFCDFLETHRALISDKKVFVE
ncbi:hypothetical protein [Telluribacter sp.]|jgi:hypothetical protein|uniref:hypothetical protein n=1 Tax=Telluribacter sp. TaxID=1978767 RepID=UPI002E0D4C95|nr:hypothetical protein [Telluribacter sp.]